MALIVNLVDGDARAALTTLEVALALAPGHPVTVADVEAARSARAVRYEEDDHYDIISAFIKSIRGSDADAGLYWLARMLAAGEDPRFIARRLVILASEDVGMADPLALVVADAAARAVEFVGLPEAQLNLAQAVVHLASAPKSNRVMVGLSRARPTCGSSRPARCRPPAGQPLPQRGPARPRCRLPLPPRRPRRLGGAAVLARAPGGPPLLRAVRPTAPRPTSRDGWRPALDGAGVGAARTEGGWWEWRAADGGPGGPHEGCRGGAAQNRGAGRGAHERRSATVTGPGWLRDADARDVAAVAVVVGAVQHRRLLASSRDRGPGGAAPARDGGRAAA